MEPWPQKGQPYSEKEILILRYHLHLHFLGLCYFLILHCAFLPCDVIQHPVPSPKAASCSIRTSCCHVKLSYKCLFIDINLTWMYVKCRTALGFSLQECSARLSKILWHVEWSHFGQKVSSWQQRAAFEFFNIVTYWSCQTSFEFRQSADVGYTFAINLIRL